MLTMRLFRLTRLSLIYFVLALLAIRLTRYDGGVAFLWVATSYLIAEMSVVKRREWPLQLACCAVVSSIATGFYGFGWAAAPFMSVANIVEAYVAALLLHRKVNDAPLTSLTWFARFTLVVGLIAPLLGAPVVLLVAHAQGKPLVGTFVHFIAGHALGNITFAPLFMLLLQGELANGLRGARDRSIPQAILLICLSVATTLFCFTQVSLTLLFLPVLPIILITFRLGRGGTLVATMLLAVIGAALTLAGHGPIQLMGRSAGFNLQFFQFYLAATVLTLWPVAADLKNRGRLHRELRINEARYRLLADHSTDILMQLDADGKVRYVSPSIWQLGGYAPEELIGCYSGALIVEEYRAEAIRQHRETLEHPSTTRSFEYEAITRDGGRRWFETHTRAIVDHRGLVDGTMNIIRDISARKATEVFLSRAASTDPLTGLPNRRAFRTAVDGRSREGQEGRDCVALLDIDHFKKVNDGFGHDAGDEVLKTFAAVARRMVRHGDMVARYGGEEFAILFTDTSLDQAMLICDRLRLEIAAAVTQVGAAAAAVRITVSGGMAPLGGGGIDEALKIADIALYEAKESGRDRMALAA